MSAGFLAVCISYYVRSPLLLFPHSRASLSPKRTPLILCLEFLYAPQSCIGRSAHNNNNAPQQALVKTSPLLLFALLGCCFLSQARRSPPPSRSLARPRGIGLSLSLNSAPHDPISRRYTQHTARGSPLGRTAPAPRIIASNYFWFRFQPWWENVVNPLREITRESKRVNNNASYLRQFCFIVGLFLSKTFF